MRTSTADDYSGASVRHFASNNGGLFKANVSTANNHPVVNFTMDNTSNVVIGLFNMQGKSIGNTIRKGFSAGSHSVTLNGVSQGSYVCRILTGKSSAAVPFKVMR